MALNPALHDEVITSPLERSNPLNDPQDYHVEGYNTFDLTNQQMITPRFGEFTPFDVFETVPNDRHLLHDNGLSLLNSVDASMVSRVNEYHDYFYVPMRSCFPNNYEKMIVNPTKGSDLPLDALPMIPLAHLIYRLLRNPEEIRFTDEGTYSLVNVSPSGSSPYGGQGRLFYNAAIYAAYILSRGQLLDYLRFSLDDVSQSLNDSSYRYVNRFQSYIEDIFEGILYDSYVDEGGSTVTLSRKPHIYGYDIVENTTSSGTVLPAVGDIDASTKVVYAPLSSEWSLSCFRSKLYDCLEKGLFICFDFEPGDESQVGNSYLGDRFCRGFNALVDYFQEFDVLPQLDDSTTPDQFFDRGMVNPMRMIAYQQAIAEYGTNDAVDNVFTSDLWMQNIRAVMFPSTANITREPTFVYNGVDYEYDYFTVGAFREAFFGGDGNSNVIGTTSRLLPFLSLFLMLRRSLRYGDYFSTGRPDFLSVGQLGVNVESEMVDPVEITQNLLKARYLQATNWMGSKFSAQMQGVYDAKPSDTGTRPYFISHRKIELNRDVVHNTTSENQGKPVTNLVGKSDAQGVDIFLDDFGVVIGLVSFDVLPLYPSTVDRNFKNYDRFSMFNAMMQNVGDQDIKVVELTGDISVPDDVFAYASRYAQYKNIMSCAHGGFVGFLPGFAMLYPSEQFFDNYADSDIHISPDFIRDKPGYFDQFYQSRQLLSPAGYFHFIISVNNQHSAARKMQLIPQLLF